MGTASNRILEGTTALLPKACIVVTDPNIDILFIPQFSSQTSVCAQVTTAGGSFYILSIYFPPTDHIASGIAELQRILQHLGSSPLVVGGDRNAQSPMWHCRRTSPRGQSLEDYLVSSRWYIANLPGNPATFSTANGVANLDVTLVTRSIFNKLLNWQVRDAWINSDHRVITFELGPQVTLL